MEMPLDSKVVSDIVEIPVAHRPQLVAKALSKSAAAEVEATENKPVGMAAEKANPVPQEQLLKVVEQAAVVQAATVAAATEEAETAKKELVVEPLVNSMSASKWLQMEEAADRFLKWLQDDGGISNQLLADAGQWIAHALEEHEVEPTLPRQLERVVERKARMRKSAKRKAKSRQGGRGGGDW